MRQLTLYPNLADELLLAPFALLAAFLLLAVLRRVHTNDENRVLVPAFLLQLVGVVAHLVVTIEYYGLGDVLGYWAWGSVLSEMLRDDFADMAPRLVSVFFHNEAVLPFELAGQGATASQTVFSAFVQFFTGSTLYGSALVIACLSLLGRLGIYHAFKGEFAAETRRFLLIGVLLEPSVVYWSGAHTKEAVAVAFLGGLVLALRFVFDRRRLLLAALLGVVCTIGVAMIKPYILLALAVSSGVWLYWNSQLTKSGNVVIRPIYIPIAVALVLAGIIGVGKLSPEFAVGNLEKRTSGQQAAGLRADGGSGGGSFYRIVPDSRDRTLTEQVVFAPAALFTALFRPLPFEARSVIVFLSSFEQLALTLLLLAAVRRLGFGGARRVVTSSAALMFCVTFIATFGTAVGLVTLNMGTLSRYRMPMMPLVALLIAVCHAVSRGYPQLAHSRRFQARDPTVSSTAAALATSVGRTSIGQRL